MDYLSLAAVVRNEGFYLAEWLAYYRSLGVEKFYIFNDSSADNTVEVVKELPFYEDIVLIPFKNTVEDWQGEVYHQSYKIYGKNTEWLIICDADEFFMPTEPIDLREFLQPYKKYSAFAAPWRIYGSSGNILRPVNKFCLENYLHRANDDWPTNNHIKSIIKPREVTGYLTPHMFETMNGTVDENGIILNTNTQGAIAGLTSNKIRVNHYFIKSYEDWIEQRRLVRHTVQIKRPIEMFDLYDQNEIYDDLSLKYIDLIKNEL